MKTITRRSCWAFFEQRPGALLPVRNRLLVALDGPLLRLLAGKAHRPQNAPDMDVAVPETEALLDQQAHSLERPQIGAVPGRYRSGQQGLAKFLELLGPHPGRPTALAHLAQSIDALLLQYAQPAIHGLPRRTHHHRHFRRLLAFEQQPARAHSPLGRFVHLDRHDSSSMQCQHRYNASEGKRLSCG
jgi:hypothetical protein